jgi:hypothetical protein
VYFGGDQEWDDCDESRILGQRKNESRKTEAQYAMDSSGNGVPSQTLPGQGGDDVEMTVLTNVSVESLFDKDSEISDLRGEHFAERRRRLKPLPGTVEYADYAGYTVNVGHDAGINDLPENHAAETAEDDLEHGKPQSDSSSHMKPYHSLPSYALLDQRRDPHWLHDRQLVLSEMAFKVDMVKLFNSVYCQYSTLSISILTRTAYLCSSLRKQCCTRCCLFRLQLFVARA